MSSPALRSPGRIGVIGSGAVHLLLLLGLVLVARGANEPAPLVYAVNLVAAPAPGPAPRRAAESARPAVESEPEAPPEDAPARRTQAEPQPVEPTPREPVADDPPVPTRSETTPLPGQTPSTGTDQLTFRQEGLRFPYPEYLETIVTEIRRRWVNPSGNNARLRVDVAFTIQRDGTVTDISYSRRSGNLLFDTEARGAIERAGRDRAFGPLPAGWNGESLPIAFSFTPERQ